MVNQSKYYEVENIKAAVSEAKSVALIDYQGITAETVRQMREEIKENGGQMIVTKNTFITIALRELGIRLPQLLAGPTALVIASADEIAPLKIVDKTRKLLEKPEFKLGIFQGKLLSLEELDQLVKLPAKEVLLAQFTGGLANPLLRLVSAMKYNQTKLVLILKAISEKQPTN